MTYHTLFWVDLYLSGSVEGFTPPAPFTLDELDLTGLLPERVYTQDELQNYLLHCRKKCQLTLETMTDERLQQSCEFSWGKVIFAELLLDNMRHVQEHASQVSLILGQVTGSAPTWVSKTKNQLGSE